MKKVFRNSSEVSHLWSHQTQAEGRCANAFFEGDTYYSYGYHYVIGKHLLDGSVAINLSENSSTTNGHVREAVYAVRPRKVLRVFNPGGEPDYSQTNRHVQNLIEKAAAAKPDGNRPKLLAQAQQVADDYNAFCAVLGLASNPNFPHIAVETDERKLAALRQRQREAAAEARVREQERARLAAISQAERIAAWRAGEGYGSHTWGTLLRLIYVDNGSSAGGIDTGSGWFVQTSRGAEIPVEDAKRLWRLIRVVKGSGHGHVQRDFALGQYSLTKINRDGSIVVGCHEIPYSEIEYIAKQLGLVSSEVEETV